MIGLVEKNSNAALVDTWTRMTRELRVTDLKQSQIALEAGVSQSAVSRLLREAPNRYSPAFRKLCRYAVEITARSAAREVRPLENVDLTSAIRDVWNGTPEHARALAAIIRAVGAAHRAGAR